MAKSLKDTGTSVHDPKPAPSARDRELARGGERLGDLGKGRETWTPPPGQQGFSNRPDDNGTATGTAPSPLTEDELEEPLDELDDDDEEPDDDEADADDIAEDEEEPGPSGAVS